MAGEPKPKRRALRVAVITLLIAVGVSLPIYLKVTQVDREINSLRAELEKAGIDLTERPKQKEEATRVLAIARKLTALNETTENTFHADYLEGTAPLYEELKALEPLSLVDADSGALWHIGHLLSKHVMFYVARDEGHSLEALGVLSRLTSEMTSAGDIDCLTAMRWAIEECVTVWINRPELLERALAAADIKIDPHEVMGSLVMDLIRELRSHEMRWSWSLSELKSGIENQFLYRRLERDALLLLKDLLRRSKSRSTVDLVLANQRFPDSVDLHPHTVSFQGVLTDTLSFVIHAEISHLHCRAFVELRRGNVRADSIPNREPFLDPYTGKSFQVRIEEDWVEIQSTGPDRVFGDESENSTDDVISGFSLERPTLP